MKLCSHCKLIFTDTEVLGGLCENCIDLPTCADCGDIITNDDANVIGESLVCDDCLSRNYWKCNNCGDYHHDSANSYEINRDNICQHCYESGNYFYCDRCEKYHDGDYTEYCPECDSCSNCCNCSQSINDYSYKPSPEFYGENNGLFFGVELEVEGGKEEALDITSDFLYCKEDGSLSNGFEIVSHPGTLDYHKEYQWKQILNSLISAGYKSHSTNTCGFHVHVSKNFLSEAERVKLSMIVYNNPTFFKKIARREASNYAKFVNKKGNGLQGYVSNPDRYEALNWQNSSTIEFRLFRGTLKYETFIATIELCHALCQYVKTINSIAAASKKVIDELKTFIADKPEYKELVNYINQRGG